MMRHSIFDANTRTNVRRVISLRALFSSVSGPMIVVTGETVIDKSGQVDRPLVLVT
jgi:hypothetical protein